MNVPNTILILGTDASGKNHVANLIVDLLKSLGYCVEKREGWFSKKPTDALSSEDKSRLDLLKEKLFLTVFPIIKWLMPILLTIIIHNDLKRFRKADKKIIVISHTGLRLLSFYLGHEYNREEDIRIPSYAHRALKSIKPITNVNTIVLDVADSVRKKRIMKRLMSGKGDHFDRYMAKDSIRSERIENFLVWLAIKYLHAVKIENNDLSDTELSIKIQAWMK